MQSLHLHLAVRNHKTNLVLNYDWSFSPLLISLFMLVFVFKWIELPSIVIVDSSLDQMIMVCCLNSYCTAFSVEYTSIVMFSILAFAEKKPLTRVPSLPPFLFIFNGKQGVWQFHYILEFYWAKFTYGLIDSCRSIQVLNSFLSAQIRWINDNWNQVELRCIALFVIFCTSPAYCCICLD